MPPLYLTDAQLAAIKRAAGALPRADRKAFVEEVAAALQGAGELGDGGLYRAIRMVQRKFLAPSIEA